MSESIGVIYAVQVKFKYKDGWSKPYTYKSDKPFEKYDVVIVPTNDFYNVGKVFSCVTATKDSFEAGIHYKFIVEKLQVQ